MNYKQMKNKLNKKNLTGKEMGQIILYNNIENMRLQLKGVGHPVCRTDLLAKMQEELSEQEYSTSMDYINLFTVINNQRHMACAAEKEACSALFNIEAHLYALIPTIQQDVFKARLTIDKINPRKYVEHNNCAHIKFCLTKADIDKYISAIKDMRDIMLKQALTFAYAINTFLDDVESIYKVENLHSLYGVNVELIDKIINAINGRIDDIISLCEEAGKHYSTLAQQLEDCKINFDAKSLKAHKAKLERARIKTKDIKRFRTYMITLGLLQYYMPDKKGK